MLKKLTLSEHFKERLVLILSEYLKDFTKDNISQLNLGITSNLVLKNLEIREDLLLLHSLPLVINEGKIEHIKISVPTLFKNLSMKVDVENVEIHVRLIAEQRSYESLSRKVFDKNLKHGKTKSFFTESYKDRKLRDWESKMKKHFRELAPPGWAKKIIDTILRNTIISIKNVNIYYESYSLFDTSSLVKIKLKELNIRTTDENWIPSFNSKADKQFKEIILSQLAVTLTTNNRAAIVMHREKFEREFLYRMPSLVPQNLQKIPSDVFNAKVQARVQKLNNYIQDEEEFIEREYRKIKEKGIYIVFPINATVRIKKQLDLSRDFSYEPQQSISIEVSEPIILMLNKDHMKYLGALNEHLRIMHIIQKNIHLRPNQSPRENPVAWWLYAIKAVTEERKRVMSMKKTIANMQKMKKYIDLYKRKQNIIHVPWLPRITEGESIALKELEEQLPLQNILQYREWAFVEIRLEAKRFFSSNQGAQRMKPLIDIWSNAVNNENTFTTSKHKVPETIRLKPTEQADLYEILALDKTRVLESYLKGHNSDPRDIVLDFAVNVKALYFLLTEPKHDTSKLIVDNTRFKVSSVKNWWIREAPDSLSHDPIVRSLANLDGLADMKTAPTIPTEKVIKSEASILDLDPQLVELGILPDQKEAASGSQTSQTSQKDDLVHLSDVLDKSESYMDHLRDVEKEGGDNFIEEEKVEVNKMGIPLNAKQNERSVRQNEWWNQNLILLGEIAGIQGAIRTYKSGRRTTNTPLEIRSLMISTTMSLPKAIQDREQKNAQTRTPADFYLKYENLFQDVLGYDFNAVLQLDYTTSNPLIRFLRENDCNNLATFLETYEKDKKSLGEANIKSFTPYQPFFMPKDVLYIDFPEELANKFFEAGNVSTSREVKGKIIHEAYHIIKAHVSKTLMPSFLFTYGVLVIPYMVHMQAEAKHEAQIIYAPFSRNDTGLFDRFMKLSTGLQSRIFSRRATKRTKTLNFQNDNVLTLFFDLQGAQSQFKIQKIDLQEKARKEQDHSKMNLIDNNDDKDVHSTVHLEAPPITIYLSTESLQPLLIFFKSFGSRAKPEKADMNATENNAEDSSKVSVEDYQKIMDCIDYKRRTEMHPSSTAPKKNTEVRAFFSALSIEIANLRAHFIHERRLCLNIKGLTFQIKPALTGGEPSILDPQQQIYYQYHTTILQIDNIEAFESFYANGVYNDIYLLRTMIVANLYDCIYDNHPLYTDKKVHVLIPSFRLHIDDNFALLCEVFQLFKTCNKGYEDGEMHRIAPPPAIEMGENQKTKLMNKLQYLLKDHKRGNQNCKHCILRYKKSSLIMNVFIGGLLENLEGIVETNFAQLVSTFRDHPKEDAGFFITVRHSISKAQSPVQANLFHLPFFVLTKDEGFFKKNIAIHCTENSTKVNLNMSMSGQSCSIARPIISSFKPSVKANKNCLSLLDDHFWVYFMSLEEQMQATKKTEKKEDTEPIFQSKDSKGASRDNEPIFQSKDSKGTSKLSMSEKITLEEEDIITDKQDQEKEQDLYILVVRKEYKAENLLKVFDIYTQQRDFKNFLALRLKEIKIDFRSLASFSAVANTLDGLQQISAWLGKLMKAQEHQTENDNDFGDLPSERQDPKKTYLTYNSIQRMLKKQNISINIDKIHISVGLNLPGKGLLFDVNKLMIDTAYWRNKPIAGTHFDIEWKAHQLLSIDSIKVTRKSMQEVVASVDEIKLKYYDARNELAFTIKKLTHKTTKVSLLSIPSVHTTSTEKKALTIQLVFKQNVLSNFNVILAPVHLNLSDIDMLEGFSPFIIINTYFSYEKRKTTGLLGEMVFEANHFEKVRNYKPIQAPKPQRVSSDIAAVGPFLASPDILIAIMAGGLGVQLAKTHEVFATLEVGCVKYEIDLNNDYRAEIDSFGLMPYDSYYEKMVTNISGGGNLANIKLYKEDGYAVFLAQGCRLIWLARTIREIQLFQRDVTNQLKDSTKYLMLDEIIEPPKPEKPNNTQKKPGFKMKIILEDSCAVIPRSSQSKDVLIAVSKVLEVKKDGEFHNVLIPVSSIQHLPDVTQRLILSRGELPEKIEVSCQATTLSLTEAHLAYTNNGKTVKMGSAAMVSMSTFVTRNARLFNEALSLDYLSEGELTDYSIDINMGAMLEARQLFKESKKEPSKLYESRVDIDPSHLVHYAGDTLTVSQRKHKVTGETVRRFLQQQEEAAAALAPVVKQEEVPARTTVIEEEDVIDLTTAIKQEEVNNEGPK